jgi:endonuclease YncB( thermonuclease family)
MADMSAPKGNWFVRHKLLSTAIGFALMFGYIGSVGDDDAATAEADAPSTPTATATATVTETITAEPEDLSAEEPQEADETEAVPDDPEPAKRRTRTYVVARSIDGDTIELANGDGVRIVGIDTPERGECGYDEAAANMDGMVTGKRVRLTMSDEDADRYGRLLRYVNLGSRDVGLAQIEAGLAIARYDSRDGYGHHPRENAYIATDKSTKDHTRCAKPVPVAPAAAPAGGGAVYYENCDAARAAGAAPVYRGNPGYGSHLDRDGDGSACEE